MNINLYKKEIKAVKLLGEQIGYGNMMDIASNLWAKKLIDEGVPDSGAFYPVSEFEVKETEILNFMKENRKEKIKLYRNMGV